LTQKPANQLTNQSINDRERHDQFETYRLASNDEKNGSPHLAAITHSNSRNCSTQSGLQIGQLKLRPKLVNPASIVCDVMYAK
jgi:hypothetical protein